MFAISLSVVIRENDRMGRRWDNFDRSSRATVGPRGRRRWPRARGLLLTKKTTGLRMNRPMSGAALVHQPHRIYLVPAGDLLRLQADSHLVGLGAFFGWNRDLRNPSS